MEDAHLRLLSDSDLRLLAAVPAASGSEVGLERLRSAPELVAELVAAPSLFEMLFASPERDPLLVASPFLVFSVLVNRVLRDLEETAFVHEWLGPGRSVPVFDVASLRAFLAAGRHRAFLAELLASYTRVSSGSIWERTARGWRRQRYSDLDPVRLAELADLVPDAQRAAVLMRIGDLALFLSGVFPEHVSAHPLQPRHVERMRRLLRAESPTDLLLSGGPQKGIWLLEWLGRRAYSLAGSRAGASDQLQGIGDGFGQARRVLNLLTGRYMFPAREGWFPQAGT